MSYEHCKAFRCFKLFVWICSHSFFVCYILVLLWQTSKLPSSSINLAFSIFFIYSVCCSHVFALSTIVAYYLHDSKEIHAKITLTKPISHVWRTVWVVKYIYFQLTCVTWPFNINVMQAELRECHKLSKTAHTIWLKQQEMRREKKNGLHIFCACVKVCVCVDKDMQRSAVASETKTNNGFFYDDAKRKIISLKTFSQSSNVAVVCYHMLAIKWCLCADLVSFVPSLPIFSAIHCIARASKLMLSEWKKKREKAS